MEMKKAVTIFLLVLTISLQTPFGQLIKLPLLVEHYIKHQKQNGVSLINFLEDHYASNHKDADFPEDQQLPFKSTTIDNNNYVVVTPIVQVNAAGPLPTEKKMIIPGRYTPQQHPGSIFHPPKM
jgi:hypothetical protein